MSAAIWILLSWIFLGLLATFLGPRLIPRESMSAILLAALLGLVGYLVGGVVANLVWVGDAPPLPGSVMFLACCAMLILLAAYRSLRKV
jgi:uncharacterized membrane protein YeaQ/YmgE (transglycosylase-associated protein family)